MLIDTNGIESILGINIRSTDWNICEYPSLAHPVRTALRATHFDNQSLEKRREKGRPWAEIVTYPGPDQD